MAARNRSPAKEFNPSREVHIVIERTSEGREIWDVVIAPSAMHKLAKAAGVTDTDLSTLRLPLEFMICEIFQGRGEKSSRAPSWPNRIKHLRATSSAAGKLEVRLRPEWVAAEMRRFEDQQLKQRLFGTRGIIHVKTRADAQKAKKWMRTVSHLEGVMSDVETVTRIRTRLSTMIDLFEHALKEGQLPPPKGAEDPTKQYIADCARCWWMGFGHGERRTDEFIAFADVLYRLNGFAMRPPAIRAQLTQAVKRRRARADEQ